MKARAFSGALVAALAIALSACSVPEVTPTQLIPDDPDGPKRDIPDTVVVERAVQKLVDDDTGTFTSTLYIAGGETDFVDTRGAWRFSAGEGDLRMSTTPAEGAKTVWDYRIFDRGFYVRETHGRKEGCWTAIGTPATPPWTPAGNITLPSQVQALLTAKGSRTRSTKDSAQGTVSLAEAVGVLGVVWTQAVKSAGERAFTVRVPVTFAIKGDRFVGWSVQGRNLLTALKKADIELDKAIAAQLPAYSAEVVLKQPGSDVDIEVPSGTC